MDLEQQTHGADLKRAQELQAQGAARLCPACGHPDPVKPSEQLWPVQWKCVACRYQLHVQAQIPCLAPELDGEPIGFDTRQHLSLAELEDGHFWFEERNRLITWLLSRIGDVPERILEIGCGTGFVLRALRSACPNASIAGSELHSGGLLMARRRIDTSVQLIQLDARRLHLREAVDLVCAFDVLEHIVEDEQAIVSAHCALRSGGHFAVAVPQHPWLWSASDEVGHHARRYARHELQTKVRRAGFELLFTDSFTSLLLPLMAMSRLMERLASRKASDAEELIEREFRMKPALNTALRGVLRFEHALRRRGLKFPVGGSRVLLARKER